jgi:cell shape-determining protein MreD
MPILRNLVPLATVAFLTVLAALPLGLPVDMSYYMPLLPFTAIHYWAVRRPALMPEWGVFLAGLVTDVLTHESLGFWSLIFLIGIVVVDATRDMPDWGALGRWLQFAATLLILGFCQWLVASIYRVELAASKPMLMAVVIAALSYPVIGFCLRPLQRLWVRPENTGMSRGGDNPTMSRGQQPTAAATRGA